MGCAGQRVYGGARVEARVYGAEAACSRAPCKGQRPPVLPLRLRVGALARRRGRQHSVQEVDDLRKIAEL